MNIDIQIERWPIDRLIPRSNNPRTHSPEQIAQVAASIRERSPLAGTTGDENGFGSQ
jgi:ParB-like chromosome segregation protein Spo0J